MTLIEGIGDEVIQFFVALLFILIVTLAWCTTNISNDGTLRTVFLLERRRLRAARRLTNHTESATIVEGTAAENQDTNQPAPAMEEDKPPDDDTSESGTQSTTHLDEETRIVEAMDAPRDDDSSSDLRRRRIAFYNKCPEGSSSSPSDNSASATSSTNLEDDHRSPAVEIYDPLDRECPKVSEERSTDPSVSAESIDGDRICIKLMYLNDEMRHVDGRLQEKLADFKRRHFQVELAANKLVKLIFNGHVLQPDTHTLQGCGMFDNCVVHCLVHQRALTASQESGSASREGVLPAIGANSRSNNNNQAHEWHLENYLFGILCCFLGAAWYLRYVYAHLYTVTATIGLIMMTGIFTIIMYGMHYPDNAELNQQRTENVQSHQ